MGDDGVGRSAWDLKEEDEIKEQLEHDGCTYFTKDEIVDRLWDRYPTMLEGLDKGLVWLDTSLTDMGINWKSKILYKRSDRKRIWGAKSFCFYVNPFITACMSEGSSASKTFVSPSNGSLYSILYACRATLPIFSS